MIAAQSSAPRKLTDWLLQLGWLPADRLLSAYSLMTDHGEALLKKMQASSQSSWAEWVLQSPHLPVPHPKALFTANREISGPWKFVAIPAGEIHCRGDVPRDVFSTDDSFDMATGKTCSPLECWAETVTAVAQGKGLASDHVKPGTARVVDWLKEQGFVASADGESAKVTVPLSGTFREIAVTWQDQGMVHLSSEIGRLEKWPESSVSAALAFLQEANQRLRLVRVSQANEQQTFFLEVRFRASGPGVWLQAALDALCTGMALVVQPLAALRDSGAADMHLAGMAANNSEGGVR